MLAAGPADVTSNLVVMPLPVQPSSCNVAVQMLTVMHAISGQHQEHMHSTCVCRHKLACMAMSDSATENKDVLA